MTKVINLVGAPGVGKTLMSCLVFYKFYCGTTLNATIGNGSVTSTGYLRANYAGTLTNTQLRVSPGTNGGEASITFYQNTSEGGAVWVVGHNTAGIGSDTLGIYSSTKGNNIMTCYNNGTVNLPVAVLLPTNSNTVGAASGSLTVSGEIHLYSVTKNTIIFNGVGSDTPQFANRSVGTKIVLWPTISGSATDYAMGVGPGMFWFSVDQSVNQFRFSGANAIFGTVTSSGFSGPSDYRLKDNIKLRENGALDAISKLKVYQFNFKIKPEETLDGFLAHQVQEFIPYVIRGKKDAVDDKGEPEYQEINHSRMVPILTKSIQELSETVQLQKYEIDKLKAFISNKFPGETSL